jgi:quercetin dioxygenase-like cupin family protein
MNDLEDIARQLEEQSGPVGDDLGRQVSLRGIPFDPAGVVNLQVFERDVPPHSHRKTVELLFVVDGLLQVTIGDEKEILVHTGYVIIPPGVVHGYTLVDGRPATVVSYKPTGEAGDYIAC